MKSCEQFIIVDTQVSSDLKGKVPISPDDVSQGPDIIGEELLSTKYYSHYVEFLPGTKGRHAS
eukprot:2735783-Ditylum_brightwellii.AAC.1